MGTSRTRVVSSWKPGEEGRLVKLYPSIPNAKIAKMLDRTMLSIHGKSRKLGLLKSRKYIRELQRQKAALAIKHLPGRWSSSEDNFLRNNCMTMKYAEMSKRLGRTPLSVRRRLHVLRLRSRYNPSLKLAELTDFEKGLLVGLIEGEGIITINAKSLVPSIIMSNTDDDIIRSFQDIMSKAFPKMKTKASYKSVGFGGCWRAGVIGSAKVLALLRILYPLMISQRKKRIAKLVIDFCSSRLHKMSLPPTKRTLSAAEKLLLKTIRELNRR